MELALQAENLGKTFVARGRSVEAVRCVDLQVMPGEIHGLLGPNGAGKTTTLRMLTTLLPIGRGQAWVAGYSVRREPARVREHIGYVSQLGGADSLSTGLESLWLQGQLYRVPYDRLRKRVNELLELLELGEFAHRLVSTYSGGQRRRLDIALGLIHQPQVLFLDEPSVGLDPQNRAHLWEQIRRLREQGMTVILTTHYLEEADMLCDRITIVDHGEVVASGTPEELKRSLEGESVVLILEPQMAPQALSLLSESLGVRRVRVEGGEALRVWLEDTGQVLPELLKRLVQIGCVPQALRVERPSLDEVFLHHTGRSLRDGSEVSP
jgi:ABC-2 type transport system ATP-binding protein